MKNKKQIIIIGAVIIVAFVSILVFATQSNFDIFDYVQITYEGVDTMGEAVIEIDYETMYEDIYGEAPTKLEEYFEWDMKTSDFSKGINYEISKHERLSNGDEIEVVFTFTDEAAEKFKNASEKFEVSGLKEVEKADVFSEFEITFKGTNGDGFVSIMRRDGCSEFAKEIGIGVSSEYKDYDLSNGDKVELVVYCDEDIAEEYGIVPKETSKMITVTGLPSYATIETLPKEKFLGFAEEFVVAQQAENDNEGYDAFTYSVVEIYGVFFGKVKENSVEQNDNKLVILIMYDMYIDGKYDRTEYLPLVFEDVLINADGTNDTTYEDGGGTGFYYSEAHDYMESFYEDYNVTKIN